MRIDENEKISIWLAGNTGLRNPTRIQDGFIAFSQSPFVGNLHGRENELGFMAFLDEKGVINNESGKDPSGSHARKWRLMFERYGFIYGILGLMLAFWFVKTIPLLVLMYFTSIATYSNYLFQLSTNSTVLCVINTLVYVAYVVYLSRQLFKEKEEAAPVLQDKKA